MPSRNHSRAAHNLSVALARFNDRFSIHQQLSLDLAGWQAIPDLALFPKGALPSDWLSDEDEVSVPPLLVIEILSPKQNLQPLIDKLREYARRGVKSCWLVEPATRVISVFPAAGGSRAYTDGLLRDEIAGIELLVKDVFEI